jgi:hypothetical protein
MSKSTHRCRFSVDFWDKYKHDDKTSGDDKLVLVFTTT